MTSETVKKAMLRDIGSGEIEFKQIVEQCRRILIDIAGIQINFLNSNQNIVDNLFSFKMFRLTSTSLLYFKEAALIVLNRLCNQRRMKIQSF